MFLNRSDVGAVCAERCMHGSQGGVARESPLYPTEQANHSLETLSTEWFGTSMLDYRILELKKVPRVWLFANEGGT